MDKEEVLEFKKAIINNLEKDFKVLKSSHTDSKFQGIIEKYKTIDDWIKKQKNAIEEEEEEERKRQAENLEAAEAKAEASSKTTRQKTMINTPENNLKEQSSIRQQIEMKNRQKEPEQAMPPQNQPLKSRIIQRPVKNEIHNLCGILSVFRAFSAADHVIKFINHALEKIEDDQDGLKIDINNNITEQHTKQLDDTDKEILQELFNDLMQNSLKMIDPDQNTIDLLKRLKVIGVSKSGLSKDRALFEDSKFDPNKEMDLNILYNRLAEYLEIQHSYTHYLYKLNANQYLYFNSGHIMYVNLDNDILTLSSDGGDESYTYYIECKSDNLKEIEKHLEFLRDNSKHTLEFSQTKWIRNNEIKRGNQGDSKEDLIRTIWDENSIKEALNMS